MIFLFMVDRESSPNAIKEKELLNSLFLDMKENVGRVAAMYGTFKERGAFPLSCFCSLEENLEA